MKALISVIVITYNQERLIHRALESILTQKCSEPFEVIIGEDHSSDHTLAICQQYAQRFPLQIKLIANPRNLGIVANYYQCLQLASGEYLMDCGGDDEWCEGRMQRCLDLMRSQPSVTMLFTDVWRRFDSNHTVLPSTPSEIPLSEGVIPGLEMAYILLAQKKAAPCYSAMAKTQTVKQAVSAFPQFFEPGHYLADDLQQQVLVCALGQAYYLPERTYYYTSDGVSAIHADAERKRFCFKLNTTQMVYDLAKVLQTDQNRLKPTFQFHLFALLMHAFRAKDSGLRHKALQASEHWLPGSKGWRANLVRIITSNLILWQAALWVRQTVKSAKSV